MIPLFEYTQIKSSILLNKKLSLIEYEKKKNFDF